jgi:hypothetical protein
MKKKSPSFIEAEGLISLSQEIAIWSTLSQINVVQTREH